MTNNKITIGIDFGTTQTLAYYYDSQDGLVHAIYDESNFSEYPSMLSFQQPINGERTQFGNAVKTNPSLTGVIREVKRFIGKPYSNDLEEMAETLGMNIEEGENGECIFVITDPENDKEELRFTAEELVAIQLRHIKEIILKRCPNADFNKVVMSVPSAFEREQIEAMKFAYELAGIKPITIINEPTAALREYKHYDNKKVVKNIMVIDIGGGTTDVCIGQSNGMNVVVATKGGNPMLGGSDFDKLIMDMIIEKLEDNGYKKMYLFRKEGTEMRTQINERMRYIHKLRLEAERAKINLSTHDYYQVALEKILPIKERVNFDITISKEDFEEKIKEENGLLDSIKECIEECLNNKNMKPNKIDTVLLVGGITKVPIVREMIETMFKKEKIIHHHDYDPITAVGKGSARYASVFNPAKNVEKVELVEEIQESIGIEIVGGLMEFIVKKGTKTPTKKWTHTFTTSGDDQTCIDFTLKKGEDIYGMNNVEFGSYRVENIPKAKEGVEKVEVIVHIDNTGNLIMKAIHQGKEKEEKRISCGFNQTNEKFETSLGNISLYSPKTKEEKEKKKKK